MKRNLFLFLCIALLSACAANFDRFPGEKLNEFPKEIQGEYSVKDKPAFFALFSKKDSTIINITSDKIISNVNNESLMLNENNVFSKFGKYYALSYRDDNASNGWDVSIVKADKNSLLVYNVEKNKKYADKLLSLFVNETYARQSDGTFKKIVSDNEIKLRLMKANSSDTVVIFKMNEESLNLIFEKYVSKETPLHLKRIK